MGVIMKKLFYLMLMAATITAPAYGMAGRFGAFKNFYSRFTTKASPATSKSFFTTKKLAVATGLAWGTGAAYAYQNPDKVIQKMGITPSYKALDYINKKSWLTNYYAKNITTLDVSTFLKILEEDSEAIQALTQAAAQHIDKTSFYILQQIINKNPQAAQIFTQPAAQHIDKIDKYILNIILELNPQAAQAFTQPAAKNILELSSWFLEKIIELNPQAAQVFTQPATQHIVELSSQFPGREFLETIMKKNPAAAKVFTQSAAEHIDEISVPFLKKIMELNPQAAQVFTQPAAQHIVKLHNWFLGGSFLETIIEKNPEAAKVFTQAAAEHIEEMNYTFLKKIMKNNPDARELFAHAAVQHITTFSPHTLNKIIGKNQQAAKILTTAAAQHISTLAPSVLMNILNQNPQAAQIFTESVALRIDKIAPDILDSIMYKNPQAAQIFAESAVQHIDTISFDIVQRIFHHNQHVAKIFTQPAAQHIDKISPNILTRIMDLDPEAAQIFTEPAAQHIDKIKPYVLNKIMQQNHLAAKIFTPAAAQHITTLEPLVLTNILENPDAAQIFTESAAQNIIKMPTHILKIIVDKNPAAAEIFALAFKNKLQNLTSQPDRNLSTALSLGKLIREYKEFAQKNLELDNNVSQSEGHILANGDRINFKLSSIVNDQEALSFLNKIHEQEKKEVADGRQVFYHACKWQWNYTQDLYTHLLYTLHDKPVPSYRFMRINKDPFTTTYNDSKELHARNKLLKGARTYDDQRKKLLFMNHALFGNVNDTGSCTVDYWYRNRDYSKVTKTSKDIFTKLNRAYLYKKYEKDIQELEALHAKAENKGTFLLLSFSPQFLKETVYTARPGGYLKQVIVDGQATRDVQTILQTLKKNPEKLGESSDKLEYCLILTKDRALNPEYAEKDLKIYPFNMAKSEEYKAYCAKRDELMTKIRGDLKRQKDFIATDILLQEHILNEIL